MTLANFAPFADQQTLALQPAQQRVQSAFVDGHPMLGQCLAQRVSVLLAPELRQHRQDQRAAPQLISEVFEQVAIHCASCIFTFSPWSTTNKLLYWWHQSMMTRDWHAQSMPPLKHHRR